MQEGVEGRRPVGHDVQRDQGVGDVRPADGGAVLQLGQDELPGDRVARVGQLGDDRLGPRHPVVEGHRHLRGQLLVRRVEEVGEQVQADAVPDARDLGAAHQPEPVDGASAASASAQPRVVSWSVSATTSRPAADGGAHQLGRGVGAVGGGAVGVQVGEGGGHPDSLGAHPHRLSGTSGLGTGQAWGQRAEREVEADGAGVAQVAQHEVVDQQEAGALRPDHRPDPAAERLADVDGPVLRRSPAPRARSGARRPGAWRPAAGCPGPRRRPAPPARRSGRPGRSRAPRRPGPAPRPRRAGPGPEQASGGRPGAGALVAGGHEAGDQPAAGQRPRDPHRHTGRRWRRRGPARRSAAPTGCTGWTAPCASHCHALDHSPGACSTAPHRGQLGSALMDLDGAALGLPPSRAGTASLLDDAPGGRAAPRPRAPGPRAPRRPGGADRPLDDGAAAHSRRAGAQQAHARSRAPGRRQG